MITRNKKKFSREKKNSTEIIDLINKSETFTPKFGKQKPKRDSTGNKRGYKKKKINDEIVEVIPMDDLESHSRRKSSKVSSRNKYIYPKKNNSTSKKRIQDRIGNESYKSVTKIRAYKKDINKTAIISKNKKKGKKSNNNIISLEESEPEEEIIHIKYPKKVNKSKKNKKIKKNASKTPNKIYNNKLPKKNKNKENNIMRIESLSSDESDTEEQSKIKKNQSKNSCKKKLIISKKKRNLNLLLK